MHSLNDIRGMLKRLNWTINEYHAASDLRYDVEYTQKNLYSINEIDITDKHIIKTLSMGNIDTIYHELYLMCNTIDNLFYDVVRGYLSADKARRLKRLA